MIEPTTPSECFEAATAPLGDLSLPRPSWEVAALWPNQGDWSESEYLFIALDTNRFVELVDGHIVVHAPKTLTHQQALANMCIAMDRFVKDGGVGKVVLGPYCVRLRRETLREPDLTFMLARNRERLTNDYAEGADLLVEVVSRDPKSRKRDYEEKLSDYARAGVAEYWIVDPQEQKITVLTLPEGAAQYAEHGMFTPGQTATSKLLDGFAVDVQAVFDAAKN